MTTKNNQELMNNLCEAAIRRRLGDISGLPEELAEYVVKVYREFVVSYLNILRQKENKPADWMPDTLVFDTELTNGMKHFFSDYQHITKEFYRLNQKIDRLYEIDKDRQPNLYLHMIDDILKASNRQIIPGKEYENTS